MTKEEIKKIFNKYYVKDLKDKNGQSECYFCKNIRHRYSLTWTSFLYEYKEHYYCYDCLLNILLQQELLSYKNQLKKQQEIIDKAIEYIKNGDLLYLANKNSVVYKDNIEIKAIVDRLEELLQILEDKEVQE